MVDQFVFMVENVGSEACNGLLEIKKDLVFLIGITGNVAFATQSSGFWVREYRIMGIPQEI